jgi:peptide/nickel transport system permease protein
VIAPEQTYWQIVRTQFRKHRPAMWGLYILILLFLLAICAPIFATSSPFAIKKAGGEWEFRWFRDLLDQTVWESGVDVFFNLLLVFLLPTVALWYAIPGRRRQGMVWWGVFFLFCFFSVIGPAKVVESDAGKWIFFPQHALRYSHPKRDYLFVDRAVHLNLVLAEQRETKYAQKLESDARRLDQARAALERIDPRKRVDSDEQVEFTAAEEKLAATQRQLKIWTENLAGAREAAEKKENQYTAILAPIGYHHNDNDIERIVEGPTFSGWGTGHFLGTDTNGRDVLSRLIYGTRVSLTIGVIAVAIYCTIGTIIGAIMGYFGGKTDMFLMRFVEIMMCFPTLAFILILVGVFNNRSIFMIMIAIGLVRWSSVARLIRGQFFTERNLDYVIAARALGIPVRRIVFKHVLPNAIHPMFVAATFGVAAAILMESGLAFLGLGDPNVPSWGQLLLKGRETNANWLILGPGFAIFLTVTVLNLVGEGLRDALDPKLRQ